MTCWVKERIRSANSTGILLISGRLDAVLMKRSLVTVGRGVPSLALQIANVKQSATFEKQAKQHSLQKHRKQDRFQ